MRFFQNLVLHTGNSKPSFGYMGPEPRYLVKKILKNSIKKYAGESLKILFKKYLAMNLKVNLKFGADETLMNKYPVRTPLIKKNESTEKKPLDTSVNENLFMKLNASNGLSE